MLRKNKRTDMIREPANMPLPEFAFHKAGHGEKGHFLPGSEVPTPPSSPHFKSSFHDRMNALDKTFAEIASVSQAMSKIKQRSVSMVETPDVPPPLTKRGSEFMVGSGGPKLTDPVKSEMIFSGSKVTSPGIASIGAKPSDGASSSTPQVSNIAR